MRKCPLCVFATLAAGLFLATVGQAADQYGLKSGSAELKSAGPLAFGPDGILFIGDTQAAALVAIQTGDKPGDAAAAKINIEGFNAKVAENLGVNSQELQINDLAVNPLSGSVFLSASLGKTPAIIKVDSQGKISQVPLDKVNFAKVELPNPPEDKVVGEGRRKRNNRPDSITDLAYVDGHVLVSGLSSADSPSSVRSIAFPFSEVNQASSLEIYHGAHGRVEDNSPIRTFVPFNINGEPNVLAGFVCTPLVRFPLSSIEPGEKIRGTTVAELGNRNRPLDMIAYKKFGKDFLLIANSSRGTMKVSTENIDKQEPITAPVGGGDTAGQEYETIDSLAGVVQLDRLNDENAIVLVQTEGGPMNLKTVALP